MRLEITNLTGMTLVTAGSAQHRSVSIDKAPVVLDREAWDHTLACAPSFGRMVERGVIRVRELDVGLEGASPSPEPDESPEPAQPIADAATPDPVVEPAPPVTQPRQQGGGKRRR